MTMAPASTELAFVITAGPVKTVPTVRGNLQRVVVVIYLHFTC
jgi:hypothetical protein